MQCAEACRRLDELDLDLDLNLNNGKPPDLDAHLVECGECRQYAEALKDVLQSAADLPNTEPPRDLWSGISERLDAANEAERVPVPPAPSNRSRSSRHLLPLAASLLVTAGLVFFVTREGDAPRLEPVAEERIQVADWEDVIAASQLRAEQVLAARAEDLPRESQVVLAQNIDALDQAIREIRSAIDENPGHPKLELLLASRVQQHARLIQRISHV